MREARGPSSPRRRRSCPAARCPGRRPVSATPAGGGCRVKQDGRPPLPPLQSLHLPGMTQTWRWRRGSARCRDRQRSRGGCSPGCAPATLRGFSGEEQGELFADIARLRPSQTHFHSLEGTSDASPSLRPESTLFRAHPLPYLPHLRNYF